VLVFDEETGELTEGKVLSTPEDPSRGVVEGIEAVCEKVGISFTDLHLLFHGTTVVTNMILTNTGSRVRSTAGWRSSSRTRRSDRRRRHLRTHRLRRRGDPGSG
jgi:N-methylhydantoinase A/oxoprolinase/acetone carboxylase beta subunit